MQFVKINITLLNKSADFVRSDKFVGMVIGERAKRARHYQGCTNSSWCGTYIYIFIT